jgi:hypothetical protein
MDDTPSTSAKEGCAANILGRKIAIRKPGRYEILATDNPALTCGEI